MTVRASLAILLPLFAPGLAPPPRHSALPLPEVVRLFHGQRLAVDPNLPSIVMEGTRTHGLQRSADRGASWNRIRTFPAAPLNGIGITVVIFARESGVPYLPTPVIFAGVADPVGNLFWTRDGGKSWQTVVGSPAGLYPVGGRWGPDGWLYLTYRGMDGLHGGAEWALNPRTGAWRAIIP